MLSKDSKNTVFQEAARKYNFTQDKPRFIYQIQGRENEDAKNILTTVMYFIHLLRQQTNPSKSAKYILTQSYNQKRQLKLTLTVDQTKLKESKTSQVIMGLDYDTGGTPFLYSEKPGAILTTKYLESIISKKHFDPENGKLLTFPVNHLNLEKWQLQNYSTQSLQIRMKQDLKDIYFISAIDAFQEADTQKYIDSTKDHVKRFGLAHKKINPFKDDFELNTPHFNIITKFLEYNRGVIIAHDHDDYKTIQDLADNLGTLQKQGVTHLFVEMAHKTKDAFDLFQKKDVAEKDVAELKTNMARLRYGWVSEIQKTKYPDSMYKLFSAAVKANIKIIPVDENFQNRYDANKTSTDQKSGEERLRYSDDIMASHIVNYAQGKFIYVCGAAHTQVASLLNVPIIGVCPSLRAFDDKGASYGVGRSLTMKGYKRQSSYDVLVPSQRSKDSVCRIM